MNAPTSDSTTDPSLRSWVASANTLVTDFPLQNLPFGVFRDRQSHRARIGVAIGDQVIDLHGIAEEGMLIGIDAATVEACRHETLNTLMGLGRSHTSELRSRLSELLREDPEPKSEHYFDRELVEKHLVPQREVRMQLPAAIGDYTDFYASIEHATRVGAMFRPDHPLLPNYKHIPIGYHGRSSSVVVSGTAVRRPNGQQLAGGSPAFGPAQQMDYEVELGFFVGKGNELGSPFTIDEAPHHFFGCCLLNDWSARDIQSWEYQPLGPFLSKDFATTISPWIVTMDALAPFRTPSRPRASEDPELLPYLSNIGDKQQGAFDIQIEARIQTAAMRDSSQPPALLSHSHARQLYWTPAQMLTHHTSNGCNLRPGDLLGTGTISDETARACLLELAERGAKPVQLPNGEQRAHLLDGDEIMFRGYCSRDGARPIGFGECRGIVFPALG